MSVLQAAHRLTAKPPLRLGPQQLAFVRCWAEGLDLGVAWHRFMQAEGAADARRARSELQGLLDQLRSLARAHGRQDIVALLQRDPEAMRDGDRKAPTLDEFREQQPPDFYSEEELLALYRAEHGDVDARSAARRRQRLRARLLLALQWLEQHALRQVLRAPAPGDSTRAWLDPRIAGRLAQAGIHTLADLLSWMGSKGFRWHRQVPRLGAVGAARIVGWLSQNEASLGPVPAAALTPAARLDRQALAAAPSATLAPLERFVPPPALDGSSGSNRAPTPGAGLGAANDLQALQAWLARWEAGSHTWRTYRREAERLLLWCVLRRRKPLSSLDVNDCAAYRAFLAAPDADWCGPRHSQRHCASWRPFEGPLRARSQQVALGVLRSLFTWLQSQHYLADNPWHAAPDTLHDAVARPAWPAVPPSPAALAADHVRQAPRVPQSSVAPQVPMRALSARQVLHIEAWLQAQAPSPARRRLGFILEFTLGTGLSLSELCAARLGWLRQRRVDGETEWWLCVPARGRHARRELALSPRLVESLREQLRGRGLCPEPQDNAPQTPLLAHLGSEQALGPARLHDIVRAAALACARQLQTSDAEAARSIRRMSLHWLRNSHGRLAAT